MVVLTHDVLLNNLLIKRYTLYSEPWYENQSWQRKLTRKHASYMRFPSKSNLSCCDKRLMLSKTNCRNSLCYFRVYLCKKLYHYIFDIYPDMLFVCTLVCWRMIITTVVCVVWCFKHCWSNEVPSVLTVKLNTVSSC